MSDTDGDSGTVTPELRIRQLEDRLSDETERMRMNNKNAISLDCVPKLKFSRRKSSTRKSIEKV